jgi:hypothetical protein
MKINVNDRSDSITPVGISSLGTPIFDNVVFPAGRYYDLSNNLLEYQEVKLDSVTLVVNRPKDIIKSKVSGRKGEISEHIGFSNYTIFLTGVIAPVPVFPIEDTDLLDRLKKLDDVPDRVPILSKFLNNIYKITHVVIEDMEVSKASSDTYAVRMSMYGDDDIDLKDFG